MTLKPPKAVLRALENIAPEALVYRSILKRFIAAVIEGDHVIALTAIDSMAGDERVILVALGLESCRESGDEWMCSNLESLMK
jgi:hypothetical protein